MKITKILSKRFSLVRSLGLLILGTAALTICSCSHSIIVTIPPVVELADYEVIGLIEFSSESAGQLGIEATRKFIDNLHGAQPGVRILEIGNQKDILNKLGYDRLDFQSIKAIGDHYGVAAVVTGTVELSEPKPDAKAATDLSVLLAGIEAKVDGRMTAKLWETASGATVWSNSSWGTWTIGGVSFDSKGRVSAGYSYPMEKQREILTALVRALNGDFWPTYEKHKVKE